MFWYFVVLFSYYFFISWLHVFVLLFLDNEHIFIDMEEKLTKYFSKDLRLDSGKVRQSVCITFFEHVNEEIVD